ncbi:hypothetical protein E2C01_050807 [Portunus trituberculatus]|uniref:Uncharacterized protein n=1 Tax=Portunus trituberculatus TaxID=210409 RepID=A0A5B7G9Y4_PORTR|nr:hypothetical protein [Portunus trituberculatus]
MERQVHPATQSKRGGVRETERQHHVTPLPCPQHQGRDRQMVTPLAAYHHHRLAPQQPSHHHSVGSMRGSHSPLGEKEDDFSGSEGYLPESSPTFTAMMDFIFEKFPEACGPVVQESAPHFSWACRGVRFPPHSSLNVCTSYRFHDVSSLGDIDACQ